MGLDWEKLRFREHYRESPTRSGACTCCVQQKISDTVATTKACRTRLLRAAGFSSGAAHMRYARYCLPFPELNRLLFRSPRKELRLEDPHIFHLVVERGEVCADEIPHVPPITPSREKRSICMRTGARASWDGHRGEDLLVVATPARSVIVRSHSS
jgi:hypothetical protein